MQLEVGAILEGKVTGITKFGAFVELEGGKTGMVHISEVASTFVKEITDYISVGQTVKVKLLSIGEDGKISLSMKRAAETSDSRGEHSQRRYQRDDHRGSGRSTAASSEPASFDDMLSKFLQSSDEKMSDLKRFAQPTRNASRRK